MIRFFIIIIYLAALAITARAQVFNEKKVVSMPDTIKGSANDYEEWLRNEPIKPELRDSSVLRPILPRIDRVPPDKLSPLPSKKMEIVIMTPQLRTDMQLAYQGHWLEQQRKDQVGGAMTIGLPVIPLIALAVKKLFPKHKSKKERQREKLQQILDNY